jgi:hypothetical protein
LDNLTDEEQEEMLAQMHECMLYQTQEYAIAEMPENLFERTQQSQLNPEANEFRPSWATGPFSSASDLMNRGPIVTSWTNDQEQQS